MCGAKFSTNAPSWLTTSMRDMFDVESLGKTWLNSTELNLCDKRFGLDLDLGVFNISLALDEFQFHLVWCRLAASLGHAIGVRQSAVEHGLHGCDGVFQRCLEIVARLREPGCGEGGEKIP